MVVEAETWTGLAWTGELGAVWEHGRGVIQARLQQRG